MRVAALYDIHGNLPALTAVLSQVARAGIADVVVGGDVASGPQPRETIERLMGLEARVHFVRGNADREIVDAFDEGRDRPGTGDDPAARTAAFAAAAITREHRDFLAGFAPTVTLQIDGLGPVLFCHGSPRRDTEIITTQTPDRRLARILEGVAEPVVVGGHTHRQLDRRAGDHRFVNAGSVGAPYEGRAGAYWALLGPDVALRRTEYDLDDAARVLRATRAPDVEEFLGDSLLAPVDPDETAVFFEELAADVRLTPLDGDGLEELVGSALTDTRPGETMPSDAAAWSDRLVGEFRAFHRGRRGGLDGPAREVSYVVRVAGRAQGVIRLERHSADELEVGMWLARAARGQGVGGLALTAVLERARELGARTVVARTTVGNAPAVAALRRLGARVEPAGAGAGADGKVRAVLVVR